jgi:hypothetical protein
LSVNSSALQIKSAKPDNKATIGSRISDMFCMLNNFPPIINGLSANE